MLDLTSVTLVIPFGYLKEPLLLQVPSGRHTFLPLQLIMRCQDNICN